MCESHALIAYFGSAYKSNMGVVKDIARSIYFLYCAAGIKHLAG